MKVIVSAIADFEIEVEDEEKILPEFWQMYHYKILPYPEIWEVESYELLTGEE